MGCMEYVCKGIISQVIGTPYYQISFSLINTNSPFTINLKMKCCSCSCHTKNAENLIYLSPTADQSSIKYVCDQHVKTLSLSLSHIPMDLEYLENKLQQVRNFFNSYTSDIMEIISDYKTKVYKSCYIYKELCEEFYAQGRTYQEMKSRIQELDIPLNTYEMSMVFNNPRGVALSLARQIYDLAGRLPVSQDTNQQRKDLFIPTHYITKQSKTTQTTADTRINPESAEKPMQVEDDHCLKTKVVQSSVL